MEQKDLQILAEIYNNLLTISIKGDDVYTLAESMNVLRQFIYGKQKELNDKKENENG